MSTSNERTAPPTRKKRHGNGIRNLEAFPLDTGMSMPRRVAAFLDWWAEVHPYDFVGYHEITKAVMGYKKLPRLDTKEVESMKSVVGRAGGLLHEGYKRALVRKRGLGARASVDSADTIRHKAIERSRKVERGIVALAKLDEIIDLKSIPDTAENRPLKQWYQRDVRGIIKQLSTPEFLTKMLPPAQKDEA